VTARRQFGLATLGLSGLAAANAVAGDWVAAACLIVVAACACACWLEYRDG
jgi:hypothetical protein